MTHTERQALHLICQLGQVSRAGYYRYLIEVESAEEDMIVRDAMQKSRWITSWF